MATIIDDHPLIASTGLSGETLAAHVIVAEVLLGISGKVYVDAELEIQRAALATQVAFQVAEGVDATKFSRLKRDRREWEASGYAQAGVSPIAAKLVGHLLDTGSLSGRTGGGFKTITWLP